LSYDALSFHEYLETIILSNTVNASGNQRQHQSPWLMTDAAHIIFHTAKQRCYTMTVQEDSSKSKNPQVIELTDDEDAWDALDDIQERNKVPKATQPGTSGTRPRPKWLPNNIEPVLEELPKWTLLADVLKEIEGEIMRQESLSVCMWQSLSS
jgi:DNA excision repair protein ERCC-4